MSVGASGSRIQRVANLAYRTFGLAVDAGIKQESLSDLKELVSKVTCQDVNFSEQWIPAGITTVDGLPDSRQAAAEEALPAPVMYVQLYEDTSFSMGLFILGKNVTLPLHDHPGMSGLIKVLRGTALITSYTAVTGASIPEDVLDYLRKRGVNPDLHHIEMVNRLPDSEVDKTAAPCSLTSEEGNFHEIKSVGGPMAFLDILAPPYDHENQQRVCNYYSELPPALMQDHLKYLIEIPQPGFFWCDQEEYKGPELSKETVTEHRG